MTNSRYRNSTVARRSFAGLAAIAAIAAAIGLVLPGDALAKGIVIKLGTLAPDGSPWHLILKDMAEQWRTASDGQVELRIFPGGSAGDEQNMGRKMKIGQLHAALFTVVGLARVSPEVQVLSIPEMVESYAELDHLRDQLAPRLEQLIAEQGYVVLHWADGGWIRYFTTSPAASPDDVKHLKLFVSTDQATVDIWKDFGFKPVALAATDVLSSLQTGMIDAAPMPAVGALSLQMFSVTKHMLDLPWAPLTGATIVDSKQWAKVPADLQPKLMAIARATGLRLRSEIRKLDDEAVVSMQKRGLTVHVASAADKQAWRELAAIAYPRIRKDFVGPEIFDKALEVRAAYRAAHPHAALPAARASDAKVP